MASALLREKSSKPDDALLIALLAGDSGLNRRGLEALHRLRVLQREIMRGSRGALVKIEPRASPPLIDLAQVGRDSPLTADYHSLVVLALARDFPESGDEFRAMLAARRAGLDLSTLVAALWHDDGAGTFDKVRATHGCNPSYLAATLWIALKPLYEAVAQALSRHFDVPAGGSTCPTCGGPAWARCGDQLRCGVCETVWQGELPGDWRPLRGLQPIGATRSFQLATGQRIVDLETALFAHAYDTGPVVALLLTLQRGGKP